MAHFIQLTQNFEGLYGREKRKIMVAIEQICFYCDHHLVFNDRAIDVEESFEEITNLINKADKSYDTGTIQKSRPDCQ